MSIPRSTIDRFVALTDALGVTRVAELIGVDVTNVSHIRAGRRRPSLETAAKIEQLTRGKIRASAWVLEEFAPKHAA